jgi:ribokinase
LIKVEQSGRVAVVGSLNADLTVRVERFPEPGETLTGSELVIAPGGKGSNQAAAAAVLGSSVRLVGAVGADDHGSFLLTEARRAGVDVQGVRRLADHATGTAMIVVERAGENTIIVSPGANGALSPELISVESLGNPSVLCLCLEVPLDTVETAARLGRSVGATVLLNLSPYAAVGSDLLALADVLLVNRSEAALLLGVDTLPDEIADWPELPVARTVVTLGGDGAVVVDARAQGAERLTPIAPTRVDVVDTTGSGDAFTGGLAHRLAAGDSLVEAARFAARAGALAATRSGAQSSYAALVDLSARTP